MSDCLNCSEYNKEENFCPKWCNVIKSTIEDMLTNYDTTFEEDYRRIKLIQECGFQPDVRIYRKKTAPKITRYLQTWCNGRITYRSTDFWNFSPSKKADGIKIKELFPNEYKLYGEKDNE